MLTAATASALRVCNIHRDRWCSTHFDFDRLGRGECAASRVERAQCALFEMAGA